MTSPSEAIMSANKPRWDPAGPLLVACGSALWGTETLWRVFLNKQFGPDVLVFYEHLYCVVFALPVLWFCRRLLRGVPLRVWWFLLASGVVGSALGTVFFTGALRTVNLSVANILLNIQPLFGAIFARYLLGERYGKGFVPWAMLAALSGIVLAVGSEAQIAALRLSTDWGLLLVLGAALCWSFSTVAGRIVNIGMDYKVASPLRLVIGGVAAGVIVMVSGHWTAAGLNTTAFHIGRTHLDFVLLATVSGVIPLFLYFRGLAKTPASVAAFCEMAQILAALVVTWGVFGAALSVYQIAAALVLTVAVVQINRIQDAAVPAETTVIV